MPSTRRGRKSKLVQMSDSTGISGRAIESNACQIEEESIVETMGMPSALTPTATATIVQLRQKIKSLEEERDFLREQLRKALDKAPNAAGKRNHSPSSSCTSDSLDSDSTSSYSSSDRNRKKKEKKEKTRKTQKFDFGKRMKTPDDVRHRYKAVLKTFKKTRSVNRSCEKHDVDRNTIAYTAVIAEVQLAADSEKRDRVPSFTGGALLKYAKDVKLFLDSEPALKARIEKKKAEGE